MRLFVSCQHLVCAALLAQVVLSACSSEGICTSVSSFTSLANTTINLGQCWDSQDRSVACVAAPGSMAVTCTCSVGGNVGATFARTEPLVVSVNPTEAELAPINSGCGWSLRPR
jgi:hypothetical protein